MEHAASTTQQRERLPAAERERIIAKLGELLGPKRVQHSIAVSKAAVELAQRFAPELTRQAELAGLVHDSAKKSTDAQLTALAKRFDIEMTPGEEETPQLLHGKVGAALLPERFGINDPAVAQAVRDHVTGRAGMGMLSQILFVADQVAEGREGQGVEELRVVARHNLGAAVGMVARLKTGHVLERGQWLELGTVDVWNEFRDPGVDATP